jgi:flavin reductase (DIM6/NTAB) family NADH-FMN oxidoreductase RutF
MLFDFAGLSARERHKLLISTIVPRPIAWVVTCNESGSLNAAPFSFFNVFSDDPPLVCLGIGDDERTPGTVKDTGRNIRRTREFVVNLVSAELAEAMSVTARNWPADVDELTEAGLSTSPSTHVAPPRITRSPVALECELYRVIDLPSRSALVIGTVLAMEVREDVVLDKAKCYIDTPKLDLIGRMHGRGWYTRMTDWFQVARD